MTDLFSRSAYFFELPKELIAERPHHPRDEARLLVIDRAKGQFSHLTIKDLPDLFSKEDLLVFNDTKVIPSRLFGHLGTGGKCECLLLREKKPRVFEALVKPAKKLGIGTSIRFHGELKAVILEEHPQGRRLLEFFSERPLQEILEEIGSMPLPPYIRKGKGEESDKHDYQTVFAKNKGAVAAPTAGLHFTEELLARFENKGIERTFLTLHVGLGTFSPIVVEDIREHSMHKEWYEISLETSEKLRQEKNVVAIGTTACRALESAARDPDFPKPIKGETDLFIYPGYTFKQVKTLLTNFHLPGSSLLMLVSAFAGNELIKEAYAKAIENRYRFFSYGDAMLII